MNTKKEKDMYFSMFLDELESENMTRTKIKYGMQGVGVYVEMKKLLFKASDNTYTTDPATIAYSINCPNATEIITYLIKDSGLFSVSEDGFRFHSPYIDDNIQHMKEISVKRSEAGKKGAEARYSNDNVVKMGNVN